MLKPVVACAVLLMLLVEAIAFCICAFNSFIIMTQVIIVCLLFCLVLFISALIVPMSVVGVGSVNR